MMRCVAHPAERQNERNRDKFRRSRRLQTAGSPLSLTDALSCPRPQALSATQRDSHGAVKNVCNGSKAAATLMTTLGEKCALPAAYDRFKVALRTGSSD